MPDSIIEVIIYVLIFSSVVLVIDAIARYFLGKTNYKKAVNRRLKLLDKFDVREDALLELRRQRGLGQEGRYVLPIFFSFSKLLLQSGVLIGLKRFVLFMFFFGLVAFTVVYFFERGYIFSSIAFVSFSVILPMLWLQFLRRRRRNKIEAQLPESIDVLKRSLNAGHPLSVSISMVAREMPDPIGSEFGLASDEMTFGLDLEASLNNMGARIGQADVWLLVVSVSIQSKTGGNLAELLGNLSKVIRERQTLRRKVRALSAEGRFSALALSVLPIFLFFVLLLIAPSFYGEVWGHPWIRPVLGFAAVLMMAGNFVMYRMVNFKY